MLDVNNCFTYAYSAGTQADLVQAVSADAPSANCINLQKAGINIAAGKRPIYLIVKAFAASGSGSVEFQLCTGTHSDKSTGLKVINKWRYAHTTIGASSTVMTLLINQALPVAKYQQYLYLYFNIFTTTCKVLAYLSDSPEVAETDIDQTATTS